MGNVGEIWNPICRHIKETQLIGLLINEEVKPANKQKIRKEGECVRIKQILPGCTSTGSTCAVGTSSSGFRAKLLKRGAMKAAAC